MEHMECITLLRTGCLMEHMECIRLIGKKVQHIVTVMKMKATCGLARSTYDKIFGGQHLPISSNNLGNSRIDVSSVTSDLTSTRQYYGRH